MLFEECEPLYGTRFFGGETKTFTCDLDFSLGRESYAAKEEEQLSS